MLAVPQGGAGRRGSADSHGGGGVEHEERPIVTLGGFRIADAMKQSLLKPNGFLGTALVAVFAYLWLILTLVRITLATRGWRRPPAVQAGSGAGP